MLDSFWAHLGTCKVNKVCILDRKPPGCVLIHNNDNTTNNNDNDNNDNDNNDNNNNNNNNDNDNDNNNNDSNNNDSNVFCKVNFSVQH